MYYLIRGLRGTIQKPKSAVSWKFLRLKYYFNIYSIESKNIRRSIENILMSGKSLKRNYSIHFPV